MKSWISGSEGDDRSEEHVSFAPFPPVQHQDNDVTLYGQNICCMYFLCCEARKGLQQYVLNLTSLQSA